MPLDVGRDANYFTQKQERPKMNIRNTTNLQSYSTNVDKLTSLKVTVENPSSDDIGKI